jgi:cobalt-zinc-cadmium efflux system protein
VNDVPPDAHTGTVAVRYGRSVSREARLGTVLLLNVALVGGLIGVGITAHSLGVLAAGVDYLADAAAVAVSLLAIWLSRRSDPHPRATTIAALVNGGWLLILNVLVAGGAVARLVGRSPSVEGLPVLVVSAIAAVAMVIGAFILGGDINDDDNEGDRLNMRAVLLDTAADAAAAAGVAGTGSVILATGGWFWLDPAVALLIAAVIGYHAMTLGIRVVAQLRRVPI